MGYVGNHYLEVNRCALKVATSPNVKKVVLDIKMEEPWAALNAVQNHLASPYLEFNLLD
jgi:hypothetical protein